MEMVLKAVLRFVNARLSTLQLARKKCWMATKTQKPSTMKRTTMTYWLAWLNFRKQETGGTAASVCVTVAARGGTGLCSTTSQATRASTHPRGGRRMRDLRPHVSVAFNQTRKTLLIVTVAHWRIHRRKCPGLALATTHNLAEAGASSPSPKLQLRPEKKTAPIRAYTGQGAGEGRAVAHAATIKPQQLLEGTTAAAAAAATSRESRSRALILLGSKLGIESQSQLDLKLARICRLGRRVGVL